MGWPRRLSRTASSALLVLSLLAPPLIQAFAASAPAECDMACCRRAKSCCCKKQVQHDSKPSWQPRSACAERCGKAPATVVPAVTLFFLAACTLEAHEVDCSVAGEALTRAPSGAGIDYSLFQRPPPPFSLT